MNYRTLESSGQQSALHSLVAGRGQCEGLIAHGVIEGLDHVPFHNRGQAPLTRRVLSGESIHTGLDRRVVVHELRDVQAARRDYCALHFHDFAEVNLLLTTSRLTYEIRLGDDTYFVEAPASIHLPAGLAHSANVFAGSGFFIALIDASHYSASMIK
jgi:hypothetical protein